MKTTTVLWKTPLLVSTVVATYASHPTATVDAGPIIGVATELPGAIGPVNKFLGIPYAAPPKRFSLPRRPHRWSSPLNATGFRASCIQYVLTSDTGPEPDVLNNLFNTHPPESEDCLHINAFAPATPGPPEGRPVVVFIPGGGWQMGNGLFDLSGFAAYEDVIAFTLNYRTNIFGFPNAHEIPVDERNLGLHDQRLALAWVQANAHAFGGDATKVTIWGESAGSMSVDIHMHAYASARPPPFRGAIMSSGQMSFGTLQTTSNTSDNSDWDRVARAVGCPAGRARLSCMRRVPAERLLRAAAESGAVFMPMVDNVTLPTERAAAWRGGRVAKVPVLMTSLAEEGRSLFRHNISMDQFIPVGLPKSFVSQARRDKIVSRYRGKPGLVSDFEVATAIHTDFVWQCPHETLAHVAASTGLPVWRGYLNVSMVAMLPERFRYLGKFHGTDVVLLFMSAKGDGVNLGDLPLTPQLYTFIQYLRGAVGRFVRNPAGGPGWPAVASSYAPWDVAALGGDQCAGATPVKQTLLDADCALFREIYPIIERSMV